MTLGLRLEHESLSLQMEEWGQGNSSRWVDSKCEGLEVETSLVSFGNKEKDAVTEAADPGDRWYSIISGQKVGLDVEGQRISKELRLLPVCMGSSKGSRQGSHTLCFTAIFKNHCLRSLKYTYFCMSPYVAPGTSLPLSATLHNQSASSHTSPLPSSPFLQVPSPAASSSLWFLLHTSNSAWSPSCCHYLLTRVSSSEGPGTW